VTDGPDMTVQSVTVNGAPASFTFEQPTYPGDPNGQDDPDPLAHPTPYSLFDNSPTYARPATAYIALWQILGTDAFTSVLQQVQRTYGGGSITEAQWEAALSGVCRTRARRAGAC
jgi:hypothetical protein